MTIAQECSDSAYLSCLSNIIERTLFYLVYNEIVMNSRNSCADSVQPLPRTQGSGFPLTILGQSKITLVKFFEELSEAIDLNPFLL